MSEVEWNRSEFVEFNQKITTNHWKIIKKKIIQKLSKKFTGEIANNEWSENDRQWWNIVKQNDKNTQEKLLNNQQMASSSSSFEKTRRRDQMI